MYQARAGTGKSLVVAGALVLVVVGCGGPRWGAVQDQDHLPLTTSSAAARRAYLKGRDLTEEFHRTEGREYYLSAIHKDRSFALAYLGLATTATTAAEMFAQLEKAAALVDSVSRGEQLVILAMQARVNLELEQEQQLLEELVTLYPRDERAWLRLGTYYYGKQEFPTAIEYFRKAIQINPDFPPPYNLLGYSLRFVEDFPAAEQAFKHYIELLPSEPNPYDSYAELLMKLGRFEESIATYKKALELDINFMPSYVGIGMNHVFLGDPDQAQNAFTTLRFIARTNEEKRQAHTWATMAYLHDGKVEQALAEVQLRYEVAESSRDLVSMAVDLHLMGDILLESGTPDVALLKFKESVTTMAGSNATDPIKQGAERTFLYDQSRVALAHDQVELAESFASSYLKQASEQETPFDQWRAHELFGQIRLSRGKYKQAIAELDQANLQDPRVQFLRAQAFEGLGELEPARQAYASVAEFNGLNIGYAFIRRKALDKLSQL